jgi:hypothetical protein
MKARRLAPGWEVKKLMAETARVDRIDRILQDGFGCCLVQFPEETGQTQSACGGRRSFCMAQVIEDAAMSLSLTPDYDQRDSLRRNRIG